MKVLPWRIHIMNKGFRGFQSGSPVSQAAAQTQSTPPPRRTRRRWWLKWTIIPLLVVLCPLLTIHYFDNAAAERTLAEAVAEADRLDPGWRLEDLEAARRKIPDDKNGAVVVL